MPPIIAVMPPPGKVILEVAADKPPATQKALEIYLSLVPGQVRKSLRRPADPSGTTVSFVNFRDELPFFIVAKPIPTPVLQRIIAWVITLLQRYNPIPRVARITVGRENCTSRGSLMLD